MKFPDSNIENIVIQKHFTQLSVEEKEIVLEYFEDEDQYNEAHQFLKNSIFLFEKEKNSQKNNELRYAELQKAFQAKHKKKIYNFESFSLNIPNFKLQPTIAFGLAAIAIIILGIFYLVPTLKPKEQATASASIVREESDQKNREKLKIEMITTIDQEKKQPILKKKINRKIKKKDLSIEPTLPHIDITQHLLSLRDSSFSYPKMNIDDIAKLTEYERPGMREGFETGDLN